jgi:hypothetical protein
MSNFRNQYPTVGTAGISTKYPSPQPTSGPFAAICSSLNSKGGEAGGSISISAHSYIFLGMSFDSILDISNKDMTIPIGKDSSWNVWLEVFFKDSAPTSANFNYSNVWWEKYPLMQEYVGEEKILSKQLALRVPVLTIRPLLSDYAGDGFIFDFNGLVNKVKRHIISDLILFQSCDGFMFLPSPASKPEEPEPEPEPE